MANWSEEIFTIREDPASDPHVHQLVYDLGKLLDGTFFEPGLQKVSEDKLYRVESVLQQRMVGKKDASAGVLVQQPLVVQQLDRRQRSRQV